MKIGSLVERVVDPVYLDPPVMFDGYKIVPYKTPVVVIDWKFAEKWRKCLFLFAIDG